MGFVSNAVPELNISMSEFVLLLSWTTSRGSWSGGVGRRTELLQEPLPNYNTTHTETLSAAVTAAAVITPPNKTRLSSLSRV